MKTCCARSGLMRVRMLMICASSAASSPAAAAVQSRGSTGQDLRTAAASCLRLPATSATLPPALPTCVPLLPAPRQMTRSGVTAGRRMRAGAAHDPAAPACRVRAAAAAGCTAAQRAARRGITSSQHSTLSHR